jgi:hypothetical protein
MAKKTHAEIHSRAAQVLGKLGGRARAKKLTSKSKSEIAASGGRAKAAGGK